MFFELWHKQFWPDLKYFIFRSIQNGIAKGELSTTQKMGIISLLPKGNKPREYIKKKLAPYFTFEPII